MAFITPGRGTEFFPEGTDEIRIISEAAFLANLGDPGPFRQKHPGHNEALLADILVYGVAGVFLEFP